MFPPNDNCRRVREKLPEVGMAPNKEPKKFMNPKARNSCKAEGNNSSTAEPTSQTYLVTQQPNPNTQTPTLTYTVGANIMFTFRSELRCKTSHELWANFAQTSSQLRTSFRPTSHELRANFAQTSHELRANFAQTSGHLCTNRTSGQLRKKFRATLYV